MDKFESTINRYGQVLLVTAMKQLGRTTTPQNMHAMITALIDVAADLIAKHSTADESVVEHFTRALRIGVSARLADRHAQQRGN